MKYFIKEFVNELDGNAYTEIICDDGQFLASENSEHYIKYLAWVAEGNEPEPWEPES